MFEFMEVDPNDQVSMDAAMQEFIAKWSLQEDSQQLLISLEPDSALKVMKEFNPRDTSRDVNGIFNKFASGVASRAPRKFEPQVTELIDSLTNLDEQALAFIERWSLGAEAQNILFELEENARSKVMKEFNPRDTGRDVNNIFMKFAQGVRKGFPGVKGKGKGDGKSFGGGFGGKGFGGRPTAAQAFGGGGGGGGGQKGQWGRSAPSSAPAYIGPVGNGAADGAVEFAAKWNLSADAQALLTSLDQATQQKIMVEFNPRDTSRDANGIFFKFAQGVAARESNFASTNGFVGQWNLNEDAKALFYNMPPMAQQQVMREFRPRDTSSDCSNLFMKFAQGVMRSCGGGGCCFGGKACGKGGGRFQPY